MTIITITTTIITITIIANIGVSGSPRLPRAVCRIAMVAFSRVFFAALLSLIVLGPCMRRKAGEVVEFAQDVMEGGIGSLDVPDLDPPELEDATAGQVPRGRPAATTTTTTRPPAGPPADTAGGAAPASDINDYADLLISKTVECGEANGQPISIIVTDSNKNLVGRGATSNPQAGSENFAMGKVNWLAANGYDTSTLCQDMRCQQTAMNTFFVTGEFQAQGALVLLNAANQVVGVLSVAGNPSQFDDVMCARQGAEGAGFIAKNGDKMDFYLPGGAL